MRDALAIGANPRGILCWLERSPNARLLGDLAASGQQLSHDLMDELPPSRYEHYVRQVLVHTGALPERHEEVERIPAWLNQILADRPTRHAALVRPFVHWFLLKRARRRAANRGQPFVAGSYLRTCTRVALELLTWLDEVPPPILAETLGLHINTAIRWADIARRDWTAYLAARDASALLAENVAPDKPN